MELQRPDPLVSILLPAYHAERTLPACIRSILRQSEKDWQCIIVDDGSYMDNTLTCARALAADDPRFTIVSTPHQGLVRALNTGLSYCRGRFTARMDADDLMRRSRLAEQLEAFATDPALAAVGTHVRLFPRATLKEGFRAYERWLNNIDGPERLQLDAYVECPIAHPTLMIRTELLQTLRYRDCGWAEDYDLVMRLLTSGHRVGVVTRRLLSWRDTPERLSRVGDAYRIERFTACKAAFLAAHFLKERQRYVLWGYGPTGRTMRRALLALGKQPSHIVEVHPRRIGNKILGVEVIPSRSLRDMHPLKVVVAVAGDGPRALIRREMMDMGFRELEDFVCTA